MGKLVVNVHILYHPCSEEIIIHLFPSVGFFLICFIFPLIKKIILINLPCLLPSSFFSSKLFFLCPLHSLKCLKTKDYLDPFIRTVMHICIFHLFPFQEKLIPSSWYVGKVNLEKNVHERQTFFFTLVYWTFIHEREVSLLSSILK